MPIEDPPRRSKMRGASAPQREVLVERGVAVPMRDGTILRADVYRPATGGRFPVLVERVAYELGARVGGYAPAYAQRGYVVVGQNVRGTYASAGKVDPFRDDGWGANQDGYDTVEWAAAQPWSNGHVGMLDGSYSGFTQYLVAPTRPPHLRALSPREAGGDLYRDWVFRGGAHQLYFTRSWTMRRCLGWLSHPSAPASAAPHRERLERALAEGLDPWLNRLPLRSFQGIQAGARSEATRRAQRLVIGPWIHGAAAAAQRQAGEVDFGPQAG